MLKIISVVLVSLFSVSTFAQNPGDPLATATGRTIIAADLSPQAQEALKKYPGLVVNLRKELMSQILGNALLEAEAKARKTTVQALLREQAAKVKDPSPTEIETVYDANKAAIGNRSLDEVRKQIIGFLRQEPEEAMIKQYVDSLAVKYKVTNGKDINAADLKPTDVLFTLNGKSVTVKDFDNESRLTIYGARMDFYQDLRAEVEEALLNALVTEEAKALKIQPGEYIAREITSKMKDYSDSERIGLERALKTNLYNKYAAKVLVPEPEPVIQNISADDDPARGPATAPVTVVMFSDFQCSACAATHPVLKTVLAEYGDKVRFVVRDFPLESIHDNAFKAALAANAANAQGKFFEFTEILYRNQDALDSPSLRKYAAEVGLNAKQFELDFNSEKTAAEVRKDMADGLSYGVNGTPAIFVNGMYVRSLSAEGFRNAIEKFLRK